MNKGLTYIVTDYLILNNYLNTSLSSIQSLIFLNYCRAFKNQLRLLLVTFLFRPLRENPLTYAKKVIDPLINEKAFWVTNELLRPLPAVLRYFLKDIRRTNERKLTTISLRPIMQRKI